MGELSRIDGFSEMAMERGGVRLATWVGGEGAPVVLLHGYPQSQRMWHRVAAELRHDRRVVLMDLRGYGESAAPTPAAGDTNYSKREMARDVAHVMSALGHETFDVVGHDRGGRVAHRLGLDFPGRVTSLAVLDIVPTWHMFNHVDRAMAESYFHWFFLTRPGGLPERLIHADPAAWLLSRFEGRHAGGEPIGAEDLASYLAAFQRPGVIEATCADYRAAATIDLDHDRADRFDGLRLTSPLLALWGESSYVGRNFDVLDVWRGYAAEVSGTSIRADHYLAEENPRATVDALRIFWKALS